MLDPIRTSSPHYVTALGIAPQSLQSHRSEILSALSSDELGKSHLELLQQQRLWFEYKDIQWAVEWKLGLKYLGGSGIVVEMSLPGDPPITAISTAPVSWMLPWQITAGDKSWATNSVEVGKALSNSAIDLR